MDVRCSFDSGATGYVVKSDAASELLPAVKAVLAGKRFISACLAGHFLVTTAWSATQTMLLSWIAILIAGNW